MRNIMISAAILLVAISQPAESSDVKIKSLEKILSEETSLATSSTMLVRCSSLFFITSQWMGEQKDEKYKNMQSGYAKSALGAFEIWKEIQKITLNADDERLSELFANQFKVVTLVYNDKMTTAKSLTGNVFDDEIINSDFDTCSNYTKYVKKSLDKHLN